MSLMDYQFESANIVKSRDKWQDKQKVYRIFAPRFPYIKSATRTPTELPSYATVVEMM
jgi:hypothetical protein